jgi:hypothetical protein
MFRMNRSQSQLTRAYAPGALFTYEGGGVACLAESDADNPEVSREVLPRTNRGQIAALIAEYAQAWLDRALAGTKRLDPRPEALCIDGDVLDEEGKRVDIRPEDLRFQAADFASFLPFPLSFRCGRCNLHREAENAETLAEEMARFSEACPNRSDGPCADNWRQLDFVMAHWSGEVASPSPLRLDWNNGRMTRLDRCTNCDRDVFRWIGIGTGLLSSVRLVCVQCNEPRELLMKDPHTLPILGPHLAEGRATLAEINMEPVSYRASAAHYPHGDRILLFMDDGTMRKLDASRRDELARFLVERYGLPGGATLSDERKQELLGRAGRSNEWQQLRGLLDGLDALSRMPGTETAREAILQQAATLERRWATEVFAAHSGMSAEAEQAIAARADFPTKYDPVRLAVEHEAFMLEKVSAAPLEDGRFRSVDVTRLDEFTIPDGLDPESGLDRLHAASARWLDLMGIAEMRLIRDVRVCDFTFGYTRTEANPHTQRDKAGAVDLPVRLRFYPKVRVETPGSGAPTRWRLPVLSIVSSNEGIYARLDPTIVEEWIRANDLELPEPSPGMLLGGRLLAQACAVQATHAPGFFGPFLDDFKGGRTVPSIAYPHVYTLLHTMAHTAVVQASALSGLELSSFAEHVFPTDLAFLVYRRGTTMDLANITSMWRDRGSEGEGNEFLARMGAPAALRCGSEGSCVQRGGACPDCVMIPETSCITRNELLSRSSLIGRGKPHWASWPDGRSEMVGYYEVVDRVRRAARSSSASGAGV